MFVQSRRLRLWTTKTTTRRSRKCSRLARQFHALISCEGSMWMQTAASRNMKTFPIFYPFCITFNGDQAQVLCAYQLHNLRSKEISRVLMMLEGRVLPAFWISRCSRLRRSFLRDTTDWTHQRMLLLLRSKRRAVMTWLDHIYSVHSVCIDPFCSSSTRSLVFLHTPIGLTDDYHMTRNCSIGTKSV